MALCRNSDCEANSTAFDRLYLVDQNVIECCKRGLRSVRRDTHEHITRHVSDTIRIVFRPLRLIAGNSIIGPIGILLYADDRRVCHLHQTAVFFAVQPGCAPEQRTVTAEYLRCKMLAHLGIIRLIRIGDGIAVCLLTVPVIRRQHGFVRRTFLRNNHAVLGQLADACRHAQRLHACFRELITGRLVRADDAAACALINSACCLLLCFGQGQFGFDRIAVH